MRGTFVSACSAKLCDLARLVKSVHTCYPARTQASCEALSANDRQTDSDSVGDEW